MKNTLYKMNQHACYLLNYHLVIVTKYRHPVFENEEVDKRLKEIASFIFNEKWKCPIQSIETDRDHVHILFGGNPQTELSKLINNFKTVSSRRLRKEFPEYLERFYWKPYFWSRSYFIGTVSEVVESIVKQYIENQGQK